MTAHPPVMDGHMLSLGKNPQPHIVQHIQALTDTHRHRSAPYILESIYLKKKITPFFSLQRTLQSHMSSYSLRKEAWKD